jgi:hypothetical protein
VQELMALGAEEQREEARRRLSEHVEDAVYLRF